jgi:hypothetical protein
MRSWMDLALMILTFVFSMIWNVEVGIVVSIIISLMLVVRRSSKTRMAILVCLCLLSFFCQAPGTYEKFVALLFG